MAAAPHGVAARRRIAPPLLVAPVMRLYRVTRDNLYQIRKRLKAAFSKFLEEAMKDLDSPMPP